MATEQQWIDLKVDAMARDIHPGAIVMYRDLLETKEVQIVSYPFYDGLCEDTPRIMARTVVDDCRTMQKLDYSDLHEWVGFKHLV